MFKSFYSGKKILVTGHTGFKGAWLSLWLQDLGAEVAGFALDSPTQPSLYNLIQLEEKLIHYSGDIRDINSLRKCCAEFKPHFVFHLAAQALVRPSYDDPVDTFATNTLGMAHMLQVIRENSSIQGGVLITSDKCYENLGYSYSYQEGDRLGGGDPYSASKGCAEIIFSSFFHSFFQSSNSQIISSARAGNVIGGGDWAKDRLVPDAMAAWAQQKKLILRNSKSTRPWQHVFDCLAAYLWLGVQMMEAPEKTQGQSFNFGPDDSHIKTTEQLLEHLQSEFGTGQWEQLACDPGKKEAQFLQLNCDKSKQILGWVPILTFEESIRLTAQWYKNYYENREDLLKFTLSQLKNYSKLAQSRKRIWAS